MVSQALLTKFTRAVNTISSAAQADITKALANLDVSDVAAARDAVTTVMDGYLGTYTDTAATVGASFYDRCREDATGSGVEGGALVSSCRDAAATDGAVRALMQTVVNGGTVEQLISQLCERADYEIKVATNKSVWYAGNHDSFDDGSPECEYFKMLNGEDYDKSQAAKVSRSKRRSIKEAHRSGAKYGVKYARVPSGGETCNFCLMLGSHGAVYWSDASASHAHANCDCRTVPVFAGQSESDIAGYDPDALYDQWKDSQSK